MMKNGSQQIVNALMITPSVIEAFLSLMTELVLVEADIIDEPGGVPSETGLLS